MIYTKNRKTIRTRYTDGFSQVEKGWEYLVISDLGLGLYQGLFDLVDLGINGSQFVQRLTLFGIH